LTETSSIRVLVISGHHFADAPRRVDLHFMSDQLRSEGAEVDFLICRLSPISRFIRDGRYKHALTRPINSWFRLDDRLQEFVWFAPFHPVNLRFGWLNALVAPIYRRYGQFLPKDVIDRLPSYTHVVVESGPSPLLTRYLRQHAPDAKFIYHAADRLETIRVHPCVIDELNQTLPLYDQIRIMAEAMRADFSCQDRVVFVPHGISKDLFDAAVTSPYQGERHAISVGDMMFDAGLIDTLAVANPDWTFHLFGKKALPLQPRANIIVHGEVSFGTIVPYIKFADIGIAPYRPGAGADYLSQSSLKMIQYSYCHLPIVAPRFAAAGRDNVCAYDPDDPVSIRAAFDRAKVMDHFTIDTSGILTWEEVVDRLFHAPQPN
jgi:2-beta-glucuronyltransferase